MPGRTRLLTSGRLMISNALCLMLANCRSVSAIVCRSPTMSLRKPSRLPCSAALTTARKLFSSLCRNGNGLSTPLNRFAESFAI